MLTEKPKTRIPMQMNRLYYSVAKYSKAILRFKSFTVKSKSVAILIIACLMILNTGHVNAQNNDYNNSLNRYAFDLYHAVKVDKENLFVSPVSTFYALLLAYEGSKNKTKQEIERVLHLKSPGVLRSDYLLELAAKTDDCSGFKVYNAIWTDKNLNINEQYKKTVSDRYFCDFRQTEFSNTESAVSDINRWISEKTNQRITRIADADNIDQTTQVLISNAVCFKGEWLHTFDRHKTVPAPFFSSVENQFEIDFMNKMENLQYYENEEYQFISKPYKDSDLSFCMILPKNLFGIGEIERKINSDFFKVIFDSAYSAKVSLHMPKIKMESSLELSNALKNAGLLTAFTNEADFSGITKETPLMLGQVLHSTWLELDEEKTEAAAATANVINIAGKPSYKIFKADHPFIFFVTDNRSGTILFMGRYVKPVSGVKIEEDTESLTHNVEKREKEQFLAGAKENRVLFVLDKKIISQAEFETINPEDIESINIHKDKERVSNYSSGNYDGVVEIKLKEKKKRNR